MISLTLPAGPIHVLCLGAHPDDIEIGCGATLLSLGRRPGMSATFLTLTGSPERVAEARDAARACLPQVECIFGDLPDGYLPANWPKAKRAMHDLAERVPRPDVIFAPRPDDAHQDHRTVGSLVTTEWRDSLILHYEIPKWDGDTPRPNFYQPIEPHDAEAKVSLLDRYYVSQRSRDWWSRDLFLGLMRLRGTECRAQYAEAFTAHKATINMDVVLDQQRSL